ncbi:MAG TPA: DUF393 domain-containing protein [Propionibacterium sp.]|nr:DUF393 domain-containing protein [Propionibacterium sp.]
MHLLYDADCGFCSRSASWLARRGVPGVRSLQSADLAALGVDADRAVREIPAVLDSGHVVYGARAIGEALRFGPAWLRVAGWLIRGPLAWPAALVYRVVARYRHHLPGGTGACRLGE